MKERFPFVVLGAATTFVLDYYVIGWSLAISIGGSLIGFTLGIIAIQVLAGDEA
jgi:hypothetical protein